MSMDIKKIFIRYTILDISRISQNGYVNIYTYDIQSKYKKINNIFVNTGCCVTYQ